MKTDFTRAALRDHEAKHATRRMALAAVQQSCKLWSIGQGNLRNDWIELASERAPTLQLLLDEEALTGEGRFIGVDMDEGVIERCREHYAGAHAEWHHARLETLLRPKDAFPLAGVLVYDTENSVGRKDLRAVLRPALRFAERQHARLGEFFLVLNLVDDVKEHGRKRTREEYACWLACALGVRSVEPHVYRSNRRDMVWVGVRYGFV